MNQSQSIINLAGALINLQAEMPSPPKNKYVKTGKYGYSYATFESIVKMLQPLLPKHGFCFSQGVEMRGDVPGVTTLLTHVSGEWRANWIPMSVQEKGMQPLGSALSYAKRYGLPSLLGLVTEDDDDGASADGKDVEIVNKKKQEAPTQEYNYSLTDIKAEMDRTGITVPMLVNAGLPKPGASLSKEDRVGLMAYLVMLPNKA